MDVYANLSSDITRLYAIELRWAKGFKNKSVIL